MSYYQELKEAAERCWTEAANLPVVKAEEEK